MNKFIYILFIQILSINAIAQFVPLDKGDIAFVGINSDGSEDKFAFVLLVDIKNGTSINFTDNGWTEFGNFNSDYPESHFTWIANQVISAGTVIVISTFNGVNIPSASIGSVVGEAMTLSVAGDQVLAYQGDKLNPNFIAAISYNHNVIGAPGIDFDSFSNSNSTTSMPTGLALGENAIHVYNVQDGIEADNSVYNFNITEGTKSELLSVINNVYNWTTNNDQPFVSDLSIQGFTISTPTSLPDIMDDGFLVYPNPASSNIFISLKYTTKVQLYDSSGKILDDFQYNSEMGEQFYSTSHLPTGIYYLKAVVDEIEITEKISIK